MKIETPLEDAVDNAPKNTHIGYCNSTQASNDDSDEWSNDAFSYSLDSRSLLSSWYKKHALFKETTPTVDVFMVANGISKDRSLACVIE
jgi:hypothetical protein